MDKPAKNGNHRGGQNVLSGGYSAHVCEIETTLTFPRIQAMKRFLLTLSAMSLFGLFANGAPLAVGAAAPDVTAPDQDGTPVRFSDVYARGTTLVYFYPKADTPGCTAQACSLRDSFADLQGEGLQILGVSADSSVAQKKFQEKYQLPFPLIADADGNVSKAFGVDMIPLVGMTKRQSFIVKDGKVVWTSLSAQTGGHAKEVQDALNSLK